ncbi:DUF6455 family protein [Aestuariivita boseongensis]|uniref:DUF6455 family protein n=1 Tax=Aestuariivita boseongensis TaxID=1470562 RepID=UPI0009E1E622|nr:DUF6455 family protein [Aestuariivita boseongensis]
MTIQGDIEEHFWLTRSVARTVGINLGDAMAAGQITPDDYSHMVVRCFRAGCTARCAEWLGQQPGGCASEPPPFCVHTNQLRALRRN